MSTTSPRCAPPFQTALLTLLRIGVGWHFLYEGLAKAFDPTWSSAGYLARSNWLFCDLFHRVCEDPSALGLVDLLNEAGLIAIGAGLLLGLFTRAAAGAGVLLLALYYVALPPWSRAGAAEGHALFVDKNVVEALALLVVLAVPGARRLALDRGWRRRRAASSPAPGASASAADASAALESFPGALPVTGRRELLGSLATLPFAGLFAWAFVRRRSLRSQEEKHLVDAAAHGPVSALSGATTKSFRFSGIEKLQGRIPSVKIGDLELSRLILGGNLIGGWAHARDLIYVSRLVKAYHHDEKVFETLALAERCGIDTLLTNPVLSRVIGEYWKRGGKIRFISDCALGGNLFDGIQASIDAGASACYVQGGIADALFEKGRLDDIGKAVEKIRAQGLPAGIGAHEIETVRACVEAGFRPDFWMKTLHSTHYWSATPTREHDNIWCTDPEGTIELMRELEEPWIAYKVLAAGTLKPREAFRHAFESGADFICVGMYDFQVVDDVNIALRVLGGDLDSRRQRPWRA